MSRTYKGRNRTQKIKERKVSKMFTKQIIGVLVCLTLLYSTRVVNTPITNKMNSAIEYAIKYNFNVDWLVSHVSNLLNGLEPTVTENQENQNVNTSEEAQTVNANEENKESFE